MYVHKKEEEESEEHLENLQTLLTQNIFIQEEAKRMQKRRKLKEKMSLEIFILKPWRKGKWNEQAAGEVKQEKCMH